MGRKMSALSARTLVYRVVACALFIAAPYHHGRVFAQGPQLAALAIEGGTLIDGNGGTTVADSAVLIEGNRNTKPCRKGQISYPANTIFFNAYGKFFWPGTIKSKTTSTS